MKIKQDFKYKIVKNFLTKEEIGLLKDYAILRHRHNTSEFDDAQSNNVADFATYADPIMESLLLQKKTLMEQETGINLLPTYSFWRMYTKFSDLPKHKDRPSCEISTTVNIASDGTAWPIFMDGKPLHLQSGDAAIYLGMELTHWREEFKGDWCAQVFLHYVDKDGPHASFVKDKREHWGMAKNKGE